MKYGKWGIFGGGIAVGLILANLFGGSKPIPVVASPIPVALDATAVCSQQAARDLMQRIINDQLVYAPIPDYTKAIVDWATVGGRPDPRDNNIFICAARGTYFGKTPALPQETDRFGFKDAAPVGFSVEYSVTLMGKQIQVRAKATLDH